MTPRLQTSTAGPYFCLVMISGATYPGVPRHVRNSFSPTTNVCAKPKSASLMIESAVSSFSKMFSGCPATARRHHHVSPAVDALRQAT